MRRGPLGPTASAAAAVFAASWAAQLPAAWGVVGRRAVGVFFSPGTATVRLGPGEFAVRALLAGVVPAALATLVLAATVPRARARAARVALAGPPWAASLAAGSLATTAEVYLGEGSGGTWTLRDHLVGAVLPAAPWLLALAALGAGFTAATLPAPGGADRPA